MAQSSEFQLPYPEGQDPVNVHGDIQDLVQRLEVVLPPLGVSQFQLPVINNTAAEITVGTPVYVSGYSTATEISPSTSADTYPILGLTKETIAAGGTGLVVVAGVLDGINLSSTEFSVGNTVYVAESGGITGVRPDNGAAAVGIVARVGVDGVIIVEAKGNGTWGALRDGLS